MYLIIIKKQTMEKSKKTFEQIVDFANEAGNLLATTESETKLTYALRRLVGDRKTSLKGRLDKVFKTVQNKAKDLQIDYASVDDKGNLLTNSRGGYEYTKDNKKALDKAIEELSETEFEFEPYFVTEVSEELTEGQKEIFKGFVIN